MFENTFKMKTLYCSKNQRLILKKFSCYFTEIAKHISKYVTNLHPFILTTSDVT